MFESAKWIWLNEKPVDAFQICYFRKKFVSEKKANAFIYCFADSRYRLWVNGKYIGFGPARGRAANPYYDTHRIKLEKGENVIAFSVQHYCQPTNIFESVEPGLICQIESGKNAILVSDNSWKGIVAKSYSSIPGIFFPECFDARGEPENWQQPSFDDSEWENVIEKESSVLPQVEDFSPRSIPLIKEKLVMPERILDIYGCATENIQDFLDKEKIAETLWSAKKLEQAVPVEPEVKIPAPWQKHLSFTLDGKKAVCVLLDFGFETLAFVEICAEGPSGTIIDFAHSECLWNNRVATLWQSPSLKQAQRIILGNEKVCHRTNQQRGFRYMVVRIFNPADTKVKVILHSIVAFEAIYPVKMQGRFQCSDKLFEQIYNLSARTVNLCMEDAYTDCPWRERSQWVGDTQPEAIVNYYCFGAYELSKKAVIEFTSGNTEEGWIPGVCPGKRASNLPTWGMRIPVIVWEYYLFTGDFETLKKAYPGIKKQMEWLLNHTDREGFFDIKTGWNFVDWTSLDSGFADGAVQGWFWESLIYAEKIANALEDKKQAAKYKKYADSLKKKIAKFYWCKEKQAFKKYRRNSPKKPPAASENIIGQHENFIFNILKIGTETQRKHALDNIAGPCGLYLPNLGGHYGNYIDQDIIKIGSPFWSFYALLSLIKAKKYKEALTYIRICWGMMLEFGATSCWEMWDRHTSFCHGWSAAPGMILPAYAGGIKPLEPGFKKFLVEVVLCDFEWVKTDVPTPHGVISVSWKIKRQTFFEISVKVPESTTGILIPPPDFVPQKKILLSPGLNTFSFKRRKN
ncbi:MAG: alpha-L-rhamnosidase C-terminal domain-containing protein [Candidatus Ratteibacteria bacterium]